MEPNLPSTQNEAMHRCLLEIINFMQDSTFAVDCEGKVIAWNRPMEEMTGIRTKEIIGKGDYECGLALYGERRPLLVDLILNPELDIKKYYTSIKEESGIITAEAQIVTTNNRNLYIRIAAQSLHDLYGNTIGAIESVRDITETIKSLEALKESEYLLRQVLDTNPNIIFVIDENAKLILANKALADFYQSTVKEITGASQKYLHAKYGANPEEINQWLADNREVINTNKPKHLLESSVRSDGVMHWYRTKKFPITLIDGTRCVLVISEDITDLKKAEEALKSSEKHLSSIINSVPSGIIIAARNGRITFANITAEKILGLKHSEIESRTYNDPRWKITDADGNPFPEENLPFALALKSNKPIVGIEYALERPDGSRIILSINAVPLLDTAGQVANVVTSFQDVSERKRSEEALRRSEENFRAIFDYIPAGVFAFDRNAKIIQANAAFEKLYGFSRKDIIGRSMFETITNHETLDETMEVIDQVFTGRAVESIEWCDKRADGTNIYVLTNATPVRNLDGEIIMGLSLNIDITDRKRVEQELERQRAFLRQVIDASPDLIFVKDWNGKYVLANEAHADFYGTTVENLIGKTDADFNLDQSERFRRDDIEVMTTIQPKLITEELGIDTKTGRARWFRTIKIPLTAPDGSKQVLGVATDITDIKAAEQRRLEYESHKRDFYRRTIMAATEGKLVISDRLEIKVIAGPEVASWVIENGEELSLIRNEVTKIAKTAGMEESKVYDFILCVGEATTNAFKHAGKGLASLHKKSDSLVIVVTDQGPGIDALVLPEVALTRGYSTAGTLGMGYKAILSVADKVYLSTGPGGTTVAIEMKFQASKKEIPFNLPDMWET